MSRKAKKSKEKKSSAKKLVKVFGKFKVPSELWDRLIALPLDKPQLLRTLQLLKSNGEIKRSPKTVEDADRSWFFCEPYAEKISPANCIQRLMLKPFLYRKCSSCSTGLGLLKTCIGYGFKEDWKVCRRCKIQNSCRTLLVKIESDKEEKCKKRRRKKVGR